MVIVDEQLGVGPATDAQLLASIRAGGPGRVHRALRTVCADRLELRLPLTASWAEAEDVAGAVYLVLWRRRGAAHRQRQRAAVAAEGDEHAVRNERRRLARYLRALPRIASHPAQRDHAEELSEQAAAKAAASRSCTPCAACPRRTRGRRVLRPGPDGHRGRRRTARHHRGLRALAALTARARLHTLTAANDEA
ncbi:hypothetical protein JCM9957A_22050 [Kineosporia succinea]